MRSSPPIRAVFFDLDDTLCDTIGTREARARVAFARLCQFRSDLNVDTLVRRALERAAEPRSAVGVRGVLAELGLLDTEAGTAALEAVRYDYEPLCLFSGVKETLAELMKTYELGVITNWDSEEEQRRKVRHLGLDASFRYFVVSDSTGYAKPDRRIFELACRLAELAPREAVFVGDRLDIDVAGAKAAGIRAIWFNHWGGSLDGVLPAPDAMIERFAELPEALVGLAASGRTGLKPSPTRW
jgi:FMN hydrolase / 5-amino-6-(5-phospho-D-ribitylamino)uracil phosphatase